MAGFGAKERFVAKLLNSFPGVKQVIKKAYIKLNALVYKKHYTDKVLIGDSEIETLWRGHEESFFGYYDKCPENGHGDVLVHLTDYNTQNIPSAVQSIKIGVVFNDGRQEVIGKTTSYNWQQGARAMWLNDELVIYNAYDGEKYVAQVYSIKEMKVVKTFDEPVQEVFGTDYFLSIDYRRIMAVRPDYGYRNMAPLTDAEMKSVMDAGIVKVDYDTGKETVLISMEEILKVSPKEIFKHCVHVVNHLMLSPKGFGLAFVHRYYEGRRRHDRLMYYDGCKLSCVLDDDMVSHYCWLNEEQLFGYVRVKGNDGFYTINTKTGIVEACDALNALGNGDGHPTYHDGKIIVDTYPDKSRMQQLMMLDLKTRQVKPIIEVYQSVKYLNETRCDMHPRFAPDGKSVYFDTVFSGKRSLCKINLQP